MDTARAVLRIEKAFGAQDWEGLYRALDEFAEAVLEAGEWKPMGRPPAKVVEGPKYAPCVACQGAGERMQEVSSETGRGVKAVMKECGVCRGSGRGALAPAVVAPPPEAPPPSPERPFVVMTLVVPEPFWPEVWGVIPKDGNPQDRGAWLGLFPNRALAERFRDALKGGE